jgi:hypothetical protein
VDLHVPDETREENLFYDVTLKRPEGREAKQQLRKPVFVLGQENKILDWQSFSFEKQSDRSGITVGIPELLLKIAKMDPIRIHSQIYCSHQKTAIFRGGGGVSFLAFSWHALFRLEKS